VTARALARVLVADDHVEMARVIADHLGTLGCSCQIVDGGQAAIAALRASPPELVITDLRMADVDGLDVVDAARALDPELPVIVMTAFGGIDSAIAAMKRGAWHYLTKPVRLDELALHVRRALDERTLRREHRELRARARVGLDAMTGRSAPMRQLYELIERVAPSPAPVLIRGESGTGKELVARAIHHLGPRRGKPFLAVNCTALPESLLETELFGHTRGAFTGASAARAGLFVEASGGTLFLDEIGDMPPPLQAKLLRVLQQGEVRAVGADESRRVDVRIVAATHHDLEQRIASGQFRADLFYRLDVVQLRIAPLRERIDDLPGLVERFFADARARNPHTQVERLDDDLIAALASHAWPGNVRELENLIERLVVVGASATLTASDLSDLAPHIIRGSRFALPRDRLVTLRELEDEYIAWVIGRCDGNKTRAAEILGIDVSTVHRRTR